MSITMFVPPVKLHSNDWNNVCPSRQKALYDVVLDPTGCILCKEAKTAMFQVTFGVIQPTFLALISSLFLASRYHTYRVPNVALEPIAFLKFSAVITKKFLPKLYVCTALQVMIAAFVAHHEVKQFAILQKEMIAPDGGEGEQDVSESMIEINA